MQVTVLQEHAHHKQLKGSLCLVVIWLCNGISTRQGFTHWQLGLAVWSPSKLPGQSYVTIHGANNGNTQGFANRSPAREKKNKPPTVMWWRGPADEQEAVASSIRKWRGTGAGPGGRVGPVVSLLVRY